MFGCPPEATGPQLKAYLLHNKVDTGFFVAAYPHATVAEVKAALAARERLIAFAVRAQAMGAEDLHRAFTGRLMALDRSDIQGEYCGPTGAAIA